MKQVGLISIILLILLSSFSMDTSSNIPVEDPYFGNGIHNGWADQNSIVIWTRLTKNSEMNYDGKAFIPLTSKQQNQLNKLADHKQIHAAQIPAELSLEDMEGACLGAFGEVKLSYHPEGFPEKRVETSWDNSVGGHKIYPSMALNQPDFFVHTGDTEYYDKFNPWAMTEDLMRFKWDRLFALPFQREFYTNTTSYFIKDDHDLLRNDTYPGDQYGTVSFERGLEIFEKEQFPGNEKPDKTVRWGKEQKDWFFKPIEESDATFKLIISPTPILGPDREKKNDNHANAGFQHCDVDENVVHTETFRKQIQETPISIAEKLLEASQLSNEGFVRCRNYVSGWLEYADSTTGLIPRNIQSSKDIWNAQDAAADNYPFMVLTAAITDRELFEGKMLDMLRMETKLSSRIGALPDDWSFSKQDFVRTEININRIMFGSSEYLKDGLLPLTEWLGESPWSERMLNILDDMWAQAMIETEYGKIVSTNMEVNGEMLQVLSRMFWMTGEQKYLDWAIRIGDYYLLGNQHPTRDFEKLKLRDHGCEIISGLCELYATLNIEDLSKKVSYEAPIHEMIDLVLEKGRNEDGLFYNSINTHTGEVLDQKMSDNFGYNLNGVYTVYLVDGTEAYREAIKKTLSSLNGKYNNFLWEGRGGTGSSDGYADAIEGALNIYNREPVNSAAKWIDSEMQVMWSKQQESGIIEGWHGDGNFARTTIMYCLWKTQGITIDPWREDVKFGALTQNDSLYFSISADSAWTGKIIFDTPRHKTILNMPDDWPRINQFPEWFTVKGDQVYQVKMNEETKLIKGDLMAEGMSIQIEPGKHSIVVAHDSNLKYVDPSIGSVGVILEPTRPTVHLPNSLVRVFPIRKDQLDDQISNFHLTITSHRLNKVFAFMPVNGAITNDIWNKRYAYKSEILKPYFYSTSFEENENSLEFTPQAKSGFFRLQYTDNEEHYIRMSIFNGKGEINIDGKRAISGTEEFAGMKAYFYAEFDTDILSVTYRNPGDKRSLLIGVGNIPQTTAFRYGISYISIEQAKQNLQNEIPEWDFEFVKNTARNIWDKAFSKINVEGGTEAQKRVFYTSLYRSYERMVDINEYGRYYSAYDHKVHESNEAFYVDNWIWDTYIALEPLHMILDPDMVTERIKSYIKMYEQSGTIPSFALVFGDWPAMTGNHAAAWITDAWFKGLRDFDLTTAYNGLKKNSLDATLIPWANGPKTELDDFYNEHGYMPGLKPGEEETVKEVSLPWERRQSVSVTIENSYDDWCIALLASELKQKKDEKLFLNRAANYKNVFRVDKGIMWPKDKSGNWIEPYDPRFADRMYFTENNAFTYNWYAKHDLHGLFDLMGGRNRAEAILDQLFREDLGTDKFKFWYLQPDASGLVGQFVMGNEPSFHIPYIYNYLGAPWKTQKRVRMLLETFFTDNLFGIPGDEDGGGMSAFVVFSMMGFFPVTPGIPVYNITSPVFEKISIDLPNNKVFTIIAENSSKENKYIQKAFLNEEPLNKPWFTHDDIIKGGTLKLIMGSQANKQWGSKRDDSPPSEISYQPKLTR